VCVLDDPEEPIRQLGTRAEGGKVILQSHHVVMRQGTAMKNGRRLNPILVDATIDVVASTLLLLQPTFRTRA
jgi:hypothetical protein